MPNYCENDLFVTGKDEDVHLFMQNCSSPGTLLDFNKFIKMPDELDISSELNPNETLKERYKINSEKYGHESWYSWRWENWDTKWNAICTCILSNYSSDKYKYIENGFLIKFSTAWNPPKPVVLAMSKIFPDLKFALRYYEMGQGFKGRYACKNGKVICNRQEQYNGNRGG
jgi:hypothetical protein